MENKKFFFLIQGERKKETKKVLREIQMYLQIYIEDRRQKSDFMDESLSVPERNKTNASKHKPKQISQQKI